MKLTVSLGRKLPFCAKVTVSIESYWIKLPFLDRVTVLSKSDRFFDKNNVVPPLP